MPSRFDLPPDLDIAVDEDFSKDRLDRAFAYIIQRLLILDSFRPSYEEQVSLLRETGLTRLNEAIQPIYDQLVSISQIGVMFTASSNSSATITTGLKSFVVSSADRGRFAAAAYLSAQDLDNAENTIFGGLQNYDRATGTVTILADQFLGEEGATGRNWRISASAPPNQLTTAHQVGAYTQAEVDALIAGLSVPLATKANSISPILTGIPKAPTASAVTNSDQIATTAFVTAAVSALKSFISNGAGDALDQFNELANAIGNDPNFAGTMLAGLANRVRFDTAQGLTNAQKVQALSNIGAQGELGFKPVRQGGGAYQLDNDLRFGWDGGGVRAQVDGVDLGKIWTDVSGGLTQYAGPGFYQKLPSGLIIQGGVQVGGTQDIYIAFPVAFPTLTFGVFTSPEIYPQQYEAPISNADQVTKSGFALRRRYNSGGGVGISDYTTRWFSLGV